MEDSTLTGSWKSQFGETEIEKGTIDGKNFSFSVSFNEMSIDFTGEIFNENEIVIKNERGETKLTRVEKYFLISTVIKNPPKKVSEDFFYFLIKGAYLIFTLRSLSVAVM